MVSGRKIHAVAKPRSAVVSSVVTAPVVSRRLLVLTCVLLVGLVVLAYGDSVGNGFVWDDHQQTVLNPSVQPGTPLAPLITSDARFAAHTQAMQGKDYRPLQMLVYRAVFGTFGADAAAFHIVSIAFAAGCALAAFAVFWRLTRRWALAAAAAALFAVHPMHAEAVDWIASLGDLGCALFLQCAFWAFLGARQRALTLPLKRGWLAAVLSVLAFAAALLWKETAAVFPLLVAAYAVIVGRDGLGRRGRMRAALVWSAPYWLVLGGYLAVRAAVLGELSTGLRDWQLTPLQTVLNQLWLMLCYWGKLAAPIGLNAYYVFSPIRSLADPRAWGVVAALFAVCGGGFLLVRRRLRSRPAAPTVNTRLAVFAALWVVILLLPAMDLGALGRNAFTERYMYLPSVGFCLLVVLAAAWAVKRFPPRMQRPVGIGALTVVLLAFTAETIARNPDWKDDATLFARTLERSPDAPFVRDMVATSQSSDPAQAPQAEDNYRQAIALAAGAVPADGLDAVVAYQGLASLLSDQGRFDQALQALQALDAANRLEPDDADTDAARGLVLARVGHGLEAEPLLRHALAERPYNENVLAALGIVTRDDLHRPAEAVVLFQRALAAHPAEDDFAASQHNNLGATYADAGNIQGAIGQMREAVRILPSDPEFHVNLASALAAAGRYAEARAEAKAASALAPNDPAVQQLLKDLP